MADNPDENRFSQIQKLCISTIKAGSITAFIDIFRLTHMEQILGNNQPTSIDDLLSSSDQNAAQLVKEFSFDNPLAFTSENMTRLQELLKAADDASIDGRFTDRFTALSSVSDLFLQNQKVRAKAKMQPLVTPFPVLSSFSDEMDTIRCADLLAKVTNPLYCKKIDVHDPILAAVARIKGLSVDTQVYPPLVVYYAILARNSLHDHIHAVENRYKVGGILSGVVPPLDEASTDAPLGSAPWDVKLMLLLYSFACYLRLGRALQLFELYMAADAALSVCMKVIGALEEHLGVRLSDHLSPRENDAYEAIFSDEFPDPDTNVTNAVLQLQNMAPELFRKNNNTYDASVAQEEGWSVADQSYDDSSVLLSEKERSNIAVANARLDLSSLPSLVDTRLMNDSIPSAFPEAVCANYKGILPDLAVLANSTHLLHMHNCIALGCSMVSNTLGSADTLDIRKELLTLDAQIRGLLRLPPAFSTTTAGGAEVTIEAFTDEMLSGDLPEAPPVPLNVGCLYYSAVAALVYFIRAADYAFARSIDSLKIASARRVCELASRLLVPELATPYAEKLVEAGGALSVCGHAWFASWAKMRRDDTQLMHHLNERWKLANSEMDASGVTALVSRALLSHTQEPASPLTEAPHTSSERSSMNAPNTAEPEPHEASNAEDHGDQVHGALPAGPAVVHDNLDVSSIEDDSKGDADDNSAVGDTQANGEQPCEDAVVENGDPALIQAQEEQPIVTLEDMIPTEAAGTENAIENENYDDTTDTLFGTRSVEHFSEDDIALSSSTRAINITKEAVSAASALSFVHRQGGNISESLDLMTNAWNTIAEVYASSNAAPSPSTADTGLDKRMLGSSVVETRVRLGAVKGQVSVNEAIKQSDGAGLCIEDACDVDIDSLVTPSN